MGIDMAPTDNAFGFACYGPVLRASMYVVQTAPTIAFYHNDMVHMTTGGGVAILTPHLGYMPKVADDAVLAAGDFLLGSVQAVFDEDMNPINYMAVGRVGNGTIAGYLLIADDPQQLFVAQEDSTGNAITYTVTEGQCNAEVFPPALNAGNTTTGVSKQEIDSSSAANTSTLMLRVLRAHPDDTPATDTYWCRYICMINTHQYGNVGVTAVTAAG